MGKGFFDYIADETNAVEPAAEPAEAWEEPAGHEQSRGEIEQATKERLADMIANNIPLSDLIITALQEIGKLTNDIKWADKQCGDLMLKLTADNKRALDLLSWHLSAQELAKQETAIITQIKRQQTKHAAISKRLDEIASAAQWQGELLSVKDLHPPLEGCADPDGQQMTIPGTE